MSDQPTAETQPALRLENRPEPLSVHEALFAVMDEVRGVGKHGFNQQQNFKFRGVEDVVNAVGPALRMHKVICLPRLISHKQTAGKSAKGGTLNFVSVEVEYTFIGPRGDKLSGAVAAESMDSGDKATAKAMSVAYRTWWIQALCLPTDEPDPDEYSYDAAPVSGPVLPPEYQPPTQKPQNQTDWTDEWNRARGFGPTGFVKFIEYCFAVGAPGPVRAALPDGLEKLNVKARELGAPTAIYDFGGNTDA